MHRARVFQSTRPMRGATSLIVFSPLQNSVSIHAPHAGRDPAWVSLLSMRRVSIHAPHAGRDTRSRSSSVLARRFNPRAPCGARPESQDVREQLDRFQSTRPMRGATHMIFYVSTVFMFQSTRPMRGATPVAKADADLKISFNPRAPCGARHSSMRCGSAPFWFQSTRPMRGATAIIPD